jgi:hypothetical protein
MVTDWRQAHAQVIQDRPAEKREYDDHGKGHDRGLPGQAVSVPVGPALGQAEEYRTVPAGSMMTDSVTKTSGKNFTTCSRPGILPQCAARIKHLWSERARRAAII